MLPPFGALEGHDEFRGQMVARWLLPAKSAIRGYNLSSLISLVAEEELEPADYDSDTEEVMSGTQPSRFSEHGLGISLSKTARLFRYLRLVAAAKPTQFGLFHLR